MARLTKSLMETLTVVATKTQNGEVHYVDEKNGKKLLDEGLIEVDFEDMSDGKAAAKATEAGMAVVFDEENHEEGSPTRSAVSAMNGVNKVKNMENEDNGIQVMSGISLPPKTRKTRQGGGSYPWATLEVGQTFFVPDSRFAGTTKDGKPKSADAYKAMTSAISSAEKSFGEQTGETKANRKGEQVPVVKKTREFDLARVEAGGQYGDWTAPESGVLVGRTA